MSALRVGQKVVCIDDSRGRLTGLQLLVRCRVYVVRGFDPDTSGNGVWLEDVKIPTPINYPHETGFRSGRFRPAHASDLKSVSSGQSDEMASSQKTPPLPPETRPQFLSPPRYGRA